MANALRWGLTNQTPIPRRYFYNILAIGRYELQDEVQAIAVNYFHLYQPRCGILEQAVDIYRRKFIKISNLRSTSAGPLTLSKFLPTLGAIHTI